MSTNMNDPPTTKNPRRKDVLKRFRRWAGKKLTAMCAVWPGRQRTSSNANPNSSKRPTRLDDINKDQINNISGTINITEVMSTDFNEPTRAVPSGRKHVFKRLRRWAGKRSRAICRVWPRRQRTDNREEVTDSNENKPSNIDNLENTNIENVSKIIKVTEDPSLTTNELDTANHESRPYNESAEVLTSEGPINNNLIGSDMNGNNGRVEEKIDPVFKCWTYRYKLFSKFDDGVMLDRGSFFFECPEVINKHIAVSCRFNVAINPFCGVGGMAIQLAMVCKSVIAMDINADKIKLAKFNATLYGVQHKIKFVVGDFFATGETMRADIVVINPPWGRGFWRKKVFSLDDVCGLHGGAENIMRIAKTIAPRVVMRLPTNASIDDCVRLGDQFKMTNLEKCFLDGIHNCLIVRFCSLNSWLNFGKNVRINGSQGYGRNSGETFVSIPRFCSTLVRLRSTGLQFLNRQKEELSYFKNYNELVIAFLAADDTNDLESKNN